MSTIVSNQHDPLIATGAFVGFLVGAKIGMSVAALPAAFVFFSPAFGINGQTGKFVINPAITTLAAGGILVTGTIGGGLCGAAVSAVVTAFISKTTTTCAIFAENFLSNS